MSSSQTASRHHAGSGFQPYIGLRPFTEQEKDRFFGRSRESSILLDKIRANRLTLLLAASGVGKSSLLQAGIMPALRTDSNIELIYYNVWSASPQAFKQSVSEHYGEPYKEVYLKSILRSCTLFSSGQLVLLLDQFEELFNYHRFKPEFRPFIEELSAAILDRSLPVSFVFSMREDFALELNAFKEFLPGVFDNYFRLEKLTREQARLAIEKPLEKTCYSFAPQTGTQEALLDQVLDDLAKREQERQFGVQELLKLKELPLLVEPPHLQIVCQELWQHHRDDEAKQKQITHAAYERAGRTAGILNSYFLRKISAFNEKEQKVASAAFDHLIGQRATKIAHSLARLADLTRFQEDELKPVLEKLQEEFILRRQKRGEEFWYELYHDIFSESIDKWNREFKQRQRVKRLTLGGVAVLIACGMLFAANDWRANYYGRYLASKEGVFDRIEVHQGTENGLDLFSVRGFCYEGVFRRQDLEADKRVDRRIVEDRENTRANLVGRLPILERLPRYAENGLYRRMYKNKDDKEDKLVETLLKTGEKDLISPLPAQLASVRTARSTELLLQIAEGRQNAEAALAIAQLLGDKSALLKLLESADASVRSSAAEALGRVGDISVAPALLKLLEDESEYVRRSAAEALGRVGDISVAPALLKLLEDEDASVRSSAAYALGRVKADAAAPMLRRYLKKPDLRDVAAKALLSMNQSSPELQKWQEEQFKTAQEKISLTGEQRKEAATVLGYIFTEQSVKFLKRLLQDSNKKVIKVAVESIGTISEYRPELVQEQVPNLLVLSDHADLRLRESTITALGRFLAFRGQERAATFSEMERKIRAKLQAVLFDSAQEKSLRLRALNAFGATDREKYAEVLYELLVKLEKDNSLRYRILHWLSQMAYAPAYDYMENKLEELEQEKADWRKERAIEEPEKTASDSEVEVDRQDKTWKKEHWEYMLGNALARIAPAEEGIELLDHPLYQVRQGAIRALASRIADGAANASLIGEIIQAHQAFDPDDLPSPFPYAAFQAIDLALWNLEYTGTKEDIATLKDIRDKLKPGQEGAIEERLEWTIKRLTEKFAEDAETAAAR
ncbi:MAG: HEAT repeat domain-containing protein [Candidatus Electrothrix sp. YB6]